MEKILIYDESCPACRAYTKGFVRLGLLSSAGRQSNCSLQNRHLLKQVDPQRARNEIPLIDTETGKTHYGVDALLIILASRWPQFSQYMRRRFWYRLWEGFYAFISSNRRIIAPPKPGRWEILDLQPDFQPRLRLLFIGLIFSCILLVHTLSIQQIDWPLFALIGSQLALVVLHTRLAQQTNRLETILDYMGHLGMCFLIGGVFKYIGFSLHQEWLMVIGSALIIGQHFVRTSLLGVSSWVSLWFTVLYLFIQ